MKREAGFGRETKERVPKTYGLGSLKNVRKQHILRVLRLVGYDEVKAATVLEISVTELRGWMRKLGISL